MTSPSRRDPADILGGVGRHWGWLLAFGIVTALAGILALFWPGKTVVVIAVLFGLQLIFAGIFRFVAAFAVEGADTTFRVLTALLGVLALIVGLWALRHVLVTVAALALLLGIFWIVSGFVEIFTALSSRDLDGRNWTIFTGLLGVLAGIVLLIYPGMSLTVLAVVLGIWLVIFGVMEIVAAFRVRSATQTSGRLAPA